MVWNRPRKYARAWQKCLLTCSPASNPTNSATPIVGETLHPAEHHSVLRISPLEYDDQGRNPLLLIAGGCQGLIWYSRAIAWKADLGQLERMGERDSPTPFVRLALHAALCGAGLITIYTALGRVMRWLGLAPK